MQSQGGATAWLGMAETERGEHATCGGAREREFFIGNLLVRVHCIIVMIRWTIMMTPEVHSPGFGRKPVNLWSENGQLTRVRQSEDTLERESLLNL